MQCYCQIVNNTNRTITKATLGHSYDIPDSDNIQVVQTVTNLLPGEASTPTLAVQKSYHADFWTMVLTFDGDSQQYILGNDVLPFAECETPANGAASLHVTEYGNPGTCRIDTFDSYSDGKWSGFDGSCNEQVLTEAKLLEEDQKWAKLIEKIIEILGEA